MENTKNSFIKRLLKILITAFIALSLLALALFVGIRYYFMYPVQSYYDASERAFEIPGLDDGFVPQGFHYDDDTKLFFISGYSSEGEASEIYVVNGNNGEVVKHVSLYKENGKKFTGHSGGIAVVGDFIYIAGGSGRCLYVFSCSELMAAENGGKLIRKGSFSTELSDEDYIGSSFVSVRGNSIVVGEFRDEPDYSYPDSHKLTTSAGDEHGGLAVEFALSNEYDFGIFPQPIKAYSIRDKVQGICFDSDKIYLSTSRGLAHSFIYEYDSSALTLEGEIDIIGYSVPLYSIDSAALLNEYKIPPMSEEIVMVDNMLHVMCESASNKYIFGKFIDGKWCYATDLEEMK